MRPPLRLYATGITPMITSTSWTCTGHRASPPFGRRQVLNHPESTCGFRIGPFGYWAIPLCPRMPRPVQRTRRLYLIAANGLYTNRSPASFHRHWWMRKHSQPFGRRPCFQGSGSYGLTQCARLHGYLVAPPGINTRGRAGTAREHGGEGEVIRRPSVFGSCLPFPRKRRRSPLR